MVDCRRGIRGGSGGGIPGTSSTCLAGRETGNAVRLEIVEGGRNELMEVLDVEEQLSSMYRVRSSLSILSEFISA